MENVNEKRMSVMLVVHTPLFDYKFFCDKYSSQEEDFAKRVALCVINNIPYTTDVTLFDKDDKIIDCFSFKEKK